mmetsp:Transcript_30007/g.77560  ORF Transcript_30007/g.77560 Transcript_30007/m.77560 type:complete len:359 (+) Transcript_30007:235-1311(+)|eukprot:jgi/Tetstr1/463651/TSEL_008512.t1
MTASDQEVVDMRDLLVKISQIESQCDESAVGAERKEAEKTQKKKFREIRKLVADGALTTEEKLQRLMEKCVQEIKENFRHQVEEAKAGKRIESLKSEVSHARQEVQKGEVVQGKLQELCRELQKQNKQVADQSKEVARLEEARRQAMAAKFDESVKGISARLDEHTVEREKLAEENDDLRQKLKGLLGQFDLTQKHAEQQLHAKDLENQLAEAKLKQEQQVSKALEEKASEFLQQIQLMKATENELKSQLDSYGSKFEEFQGTLTKSNEVFSKLKADADSQTKLVKSLDKKLRASEKERASVKTKYDEVASALLEKANEAEQLKRQKAALESLCRKLKSDATDHCSNVSTVVDAEAME